jgi:hypothetical protein
MFLGREAAAACTQSKTKSISLSPQNEVTTAFSRESHKRKLLQTIRRVNFRAKAVENCQFAVKNDYGAPFFTIFHMCESLVPFMTLTCAFKCSLVLATKCVVSFEREMWSKSLS